MNLQRTGTNDVLDLCKRKMISFLHQQFITNMLIKKLLRQFLNKSDGFALEEDTT